ncbi:MAG: DNA polymerase III subunit gamma/tau [Nitrospinae bacterium]|nr:DNA polymerase III subunit gamma/tau [Nitrospinota bacterium]
MSYLVTARKWRPQGFEEVIGQAHVCRTLQNAILNRRIAHAYLFTGTRGVGKTTTARILAKALNCQEGPTPQPCNRCLFCREITAGSSVDVLEIDGASNRGIDEIRELRESTRYAPARGRYKVYIIDEVHMLTKEAFNALLKTLEEPPSHVVFILATTEPNKIPVTILSRCQRFDLKPLPLMDILTRLELISQQEGMNLPPEILSHIARKARGSMRDAQSLLDQVASFAHGGEVGNDLLAAVLGRVDREWLFALTGAILGKNPSEVLRLFQDLSIDQYDIRDLCRELLETIRHLIVLRVSKEALKLIDLPPAEVERMGQQSQKVSLEELDQLFTLLTRAEGEMRSSFHPHLILEMALVRMTQIHPGRPIGEVIQRMEEMERRLSGQRVMGVPSELRGGELPEKGIAENAEIPVAVQSRSGAEETPGGTRVPTKPVEEEGADSPRDAERHAWQAIKTHLEKKDELLASFLQQHVLVKELGQEKLILELEAGCPSFFLSFVQDGDKLRVVEELARQVTGRALKVEFAQKEAPTEPSAKGDGLARRAEASLLKQPLSSGGDGAEASWRIAEPAGISLGRLKEGGAKAPGGPSGSVELEGIVREAQEIFGGRIYPEGNWPKAFPLFFSEPASEAEGLSNLEKEDELESI